MPPEIAKAIIAVKKQIKQIGVTDSNVHAGYKYVSVDRFYEIIGPMMADAGLAVLVNESESEVRINETTDNKGQLRKTAWLFATYQLTFLHESGAMSTLPMTHTLALPMSGPQAYGAAQSYVEKQFLRQVFKVPTGDKDADDLAPSEDAPGRARAQEAPRGGNRATGREQAPTASSEAQNDARTRWKEIASAIAACNTVPDLDGIEKMPAWAACHEKIVASDGVPAANQAMDNLRNKIEDRKALLLDDARGSLKAFEV
jgi:hypothetical protein